MTPGPLMIDVRGLGKRYPPAGGVPRTLAQRIAGTLAPAEPRWALRDVTFPVHAGEVVGLIGRNGAGKSTLLRLLSRVVRPTAGEADLWGRLGSLLELGTGFHPDLSGRENVFLNGALLGLGRAEVRARYEAIAAFAELGDALEAPVRTYSSGMYLRLGFAVAAHLDAEILVLDEVLAVGDEFFRRKCLDHVRAACAGGRTVLLVTHDLGMVSDLCTRALLLENGRLVADGAPASVVAAYLSRPQGEA